MTLFPQSSSGGSTTIPQGSYSLHKLLGSDLGDDREGHDWAAELLKIPPSTALELLSSNIKSLIESSEKDSAGHRLVDGLSPQVRARSESVSSGDTTPLQVTELHCSPTAEELGRDLIQQSILSKRFLSKREPPITVKDYLLRLHRYCPMSTAVYLAASCYITRIVVMDRVMELNPRNVHRLVLACLRVAMKTLEDLSYAHSRVAKVGGVTERELSRLEISFCFMADFELRVDSRMLFNQMKYLEDHGGD
ncbi:hypothetical protein FE257_003463 [Aspergillus nanangensis]|uniref:Cyclin-dependent protein kinase complex component n=1 Tax=Aspergillus nanangensis TaxID=2582783 RepID=A0AAD4GNK3_ASPNN|nr:hypothetical protein FE257_003463 [Aspergillus nanangensis]